MNTNMNKTIVATIIALVTIVGTIMALNTANVSKDTFEVYKEGQSKQEITVNERLTRMEGKLDVLLERTK